MVGGTCDNALIEIKLECNAYEHYKGSMCPALNQYLQVFSHTVKILKRVLVIYHLTSASRMCQNTSQIFYSCENRRSHDVCGSKQAELISGSLRELMCLSYSILLALATSCSLYLTVFSTNVPTPLTLPLTLASFPVSLALADVPKGPHVS